MKRNRYHFGSLLLAGCLAAFSPAPAGTAQAQTFRGRAHEIRTHPLQTAQNVRRDRIKRPVRLIKRLPAGAHRIHVRGANYYFSEGRFYRHEAGAYVPTSAPIGAVVRELPVGTRRFVVGRQSYFTDGGIFYIRIRNGFRVVSPPVAFFGRHNWISTVSVGLPGFIWLPRLRYVWSENERAYRAQVYENARTFKSGRGAARNLEASATTGSSLRGSTIERNARSGRIDG